MPFIPGHVPGTALLRLERPEPGIDKFILLVKPVTTVGRHPTNHVCLPRNTVSRFHARVVRDADTYYVEDLGSSNGTFVNEERIKRREVINGDRVTFGNLTFDFFLDEESPEPSRESSDTHVELRSSPSGERPEEVLHVVPVQESGSALTTIGDMDSVAMASRYLSAHYDLLEIIRQRPGLDRLLDSALDLLMQTVEAERGVIMLRDPLSEDLEPVAVKVDDPALRERHLTISQTIVDRCINERLSILSSDAATDARFSGSDSIFQQQVHSAICVPLIIRTRLLGVCYLDRLQGMVVFRHSDLEFVTNLSSQLALAIDNLRMVRERVQAEQMAIIGRTMAEVSHSIKNILGVTRPATEMLDTRLENGDLEGVRNTWKAIRHSMDRMHSLANAMLDYSRTEEAQRTEVDLNAVAREVHETLLAEVEQAGIELALETTPDLHRCWLDRAGLFDALVNLVINARDALMGTGNARIQISTRALPGGFATVEVADNGPGIPPELRDKVFVPFFSSKGAHGNGMGLAMVRKFALDMGGHIDLESEPSVRTAVTLRFPAIAPDDAVSSALLP